MSCVTSSSEWSRSTSESVTTEMGSPAEHFEHWRERTEPEAIVSVEMFEGSTETSSRVIAAVEVVSVLLMSSSAFAR